MTHPLSLTPYFQDAQVSAFRLETRRRYALAYEASMFDDFINGRPIGDPRTADWFSPWISRLTASPADWSRVRIEDEPPTDYQRFARWASSWSEEEEIRYLTRSAARRAGVPDDEDWWLFDDQTIIRLVFTSSDNIDQYELVSADELDRYQRIRDLAQAAAPRQVRPLRGAG